MSADSSSYGLGAELKQQQIDGTWRPVVFALRSLMDIENRYEQVEKETFALTWACKKLSDFFIGVQCFVLQIDHKPLASLLSPQRALDNMLPGI